MAQHTPHVSWSPAMAGCLNRFIKQKNTKFWAMKSGKQKSTNENWVKIKKWFALPTKHGDEACEHFTTKQGRFPHELHHYNMDQVPLPFVVNMDQTYTTNGDADVQ